MAWDKHLWYWATAWACCVRRFLADLADTGFEVLNWSGGLEVREVRAKTEGRLCLMGNVPPEAVRQSAREPQSR